MLKNEVDYRLAKWLLRIMLVDEVITESEMHSALVQVARHYNPPFADLEEEIRSELTREGESQC